MNALGLTGCAMCVVDSKGCAMRDFSPYGCVMRDFSPKRYVTRDFSPKGCGVIAGGKRSAAPGKPPPKEPRP